MLMIFSFKTHLRVELLLLVCPRIVFDILLVLFFFESVGFPLLSFFLSFNPLLLGRGVLNPQGIRWVKLDNEDLPGGIFYVKVFG